MRRSPWLILAALAALAGLVFASFSTHDFVQHLDRQVHSITCSFMPGLADPLMGESGCQATMMSPYSSVFRTSMWGGLPISLPGMALFAFLLFRTLDLLFNQPESARAPRIFLVAAAAVPLLTSLVMGYIAFNVLDAACKLCIGIYLSSVVFFIAAVLEWRTAPRRVPGEDTSHDDAAPSRAYVYGVGTAVGFVAVPVLVYTLLVPDQSKYIGACGELPAVDGIASTLVAVGGTSGGKAAVELLDPLCSSCKAMEGRLEASGLGAQIDRKAILFPLDHCNWNVGAAMHPGACVVSEAVLCSGAKADEVLQWAYAHQAEIKAVADTAAGPEQAGEDVKARNKRVDDAVAAHVVGAFPGVKSCLGTPAVRKQLGDGMRWASRNQLPVTTPQLFVEGRKLCDEDTDLGLDYALSRLIARGPAASEATP